MKTLACVGRPHAALCHGYNRRHVPHSQASAVFHTCRSARAYRIALASLVGGLESTLGSAKGIYSGSLAMDPKNRGSASLIQAGGIKAVPTEQVQTLFLVTIPEQ